MVTAPVPTSVDYQQQARQLVLTYADGQSYTFSAEFLRVMSPSAEVKGHGQPVLQTGKREVKIWQIEPVGRYALKLSFDDGHDTGLYSWDYLAHLGQNQAHLWQDYLTQLAEQGKSRQPSLIPLSSSE